LLDRIEPYYDTLEQTKASTEHEPPPADEDGNEILLPEAESAPWERPTVDRDFKVRVWDTLIARDDIIVGDQRPGRCTLSLDEVEALPIKEPLEEPIDPELLSQPAPGADSEAPAVECQPRIHVAQSRLWLVLTGHDVDKAKLPFSEWQLLLAIAAAGKNGIIQAEARNQTGQDKRSVPRRTDFLAQKGYIEKKQVLAFSQKTSLLTHKIFLETKAVQQEIPNPSELPAHVLTQDLKPVPGHEHWTGIFVDTEMVARAAVAIIRAWGVIRRTHILAKMNIHDLRLRKTLERTIRKLFELKICKRVSALLPDNPKIFKDCVKFLREPTDEEWSHFKKKLTSQGFKNRPSRAKPKSEHKPRVRKRTKPKSKKAQIENSSDDAFDDDEGEESEESDGDFFAGDDEETYDAAEKPTLMTSTKESLEDTIEEVIEANPGSEGISEEDLLAEVDSLTKKDLLALFTPFDYSSAQPSDLRMLRVVREPIEKAGKEIHQYYTILDFKRRVNEGESTWDGANVLRSSKAVGNLTSMDRNITHIPEISTTTPQLIAPTSSSTTTTISTTEPPSTAATEMNRPTGATQRAVSSRYSTPAASSGTGTPAATPSRPHVGPPKKPRGRPRKARPAEEAQGVVFTSHDQLQREAGIPGVYFDIPDFESPKERIRGQPGLVPKGRPPKKFMALFKSDKMKDLDWRPKEPKPFVKDVPVDEGDDAAPEQKPHAANQHQFQSMPIASMVTPNVDISQSTETPARSFLDVGNKFATALPTTYKSPYQSTPARASIPKPTQLPSYVSPYAASQQRAYSSPYAQPSTASKPSIAVTQPEDSLVVTPAQSSQKPSVQPYRSPYATVDAAKPPQAPLPTAPSLPAFETPCTQPTPSRQYKSPYAQVTIPSAVTPDTSGPSSAEISPTTTDPQALADRQLVAEIEAAARELSPVVEQPGPQLSEEQQKQDADINAAAGEIYPDQAIQLAVCKDGIVGNLCLDVEKTQLTFFPLDIENLESKFTLDISFISSAPITDIEAYELIITTAAESTEESEEVENHNEMKFRFASTSVNAANNLRAKIATAMTVEELKAKKAALPSWVFPVPDGGPKPFRCDQCDGSWKNYEGIKYHKTKAHVACNPNWTPPPTPPPGDERKKKRKGYVDLDELPPEEAARIAAQRQEGAAAEAVPEDEGRPKRRAYRRRQLIARKERIEPQESQEPEEKEERPTNIEQTVTPGPATPAPIEAIAAEDASKAATPEKRVLLAAKAKFKYPTSNDRDNIERRTGPVVTQQRKDIIMELIEANGGAFPGDQGLWFALHATWTQKYPHSVVQDYKYCNQAVALLEDGGQITKLKFSFRDQQKGRMRTRAVVTKKGVDPLGPEVAAIKEKIKEGFPKYYCPPAFAPPEAVQSMLEARESRPSEEERQKRMLEREQQEAPEVREEKEAEALKQARIVSTVVEQPKPAPDSRRVSSSSEDEIALLSAPFYAPDPDAEGETDEEYQKNMARRGRKGLKKTPTKRIRSDSFREGQSSRMKALWASLRAQGSTLRDLGQDLPMDSEAMVIEESESESEASEAERDVDVDMEVEAEPEPEPQPLTASEQKQADHDLLYGWQTAPSYLQAPDGSWSQEPPKPKNPKKQYMRKPTLPEPITYMQTADNPAWSFRPFGHGVRPIYARPSKRVGNQKYLDKIESSFRPIIIPKTRLFGPARPAKSKNGYGPLALEGAVRQTRKRRREVSVAVSEESPRKRGRKSRKDEIRDEMPAYGVNEAGEEIPWPDFKPLPLPLYMRTKPLMPEWSNNPGLASLVEHVKDFDAPSIATLDNGISSRRSSGDMSASGFGRSYSVSRAFDDGLADTDGEELPYVVRRNEPKTASGATGHRMAGLFSRSTASFKDRLPKSLESILSETKGKESEYATIDDQVISEVTAVAEWEQSIRGRTLLGMGTIIPGQIFIHHTFDTLKVPDSEGPTPIVWSADNSFTLETLPYQLLSYDPADLLAPPKAKRIYNRRQMPHLASSYFGMVEATASDFEGGPSRKRRFPDIFASGEPRPKRIYRRAAQTKDFRIRRLTCLPFDVQGLPLPDNDPLFQVTISHHGISGHRKRTNERTVISEAMDDRLIVAVIVIRTLMGGLDQSVDWVLVSSLFPQCTMNWVRRHFGILAEKHGKRLEKMTEDFQAAFLEAYESGELPTLDYDNHLAYDWNALIEWTMQRTQAVSAAHVSLPHSRERFDKMFELQDTEERLWRDSYFNSALPVHKRIAHASAGNAVLPLSPPPEAPLKADEDLLRIARSWARASTLTPAASFDAATASVKLHSLGQEVMRDAIAQLLDARVIMPVNKGRPVPGRGFEATDALMASFSRVLSRAHFDEAVAFKTRLDAAFRAGRTVMLEYTASEGEILAATNLQAGRRTEQRGVDVPNNRFGLTEGNYQTKQMDKGKLLFGIEIAPSESYVYDEAHPLRVAGLLDASANPPPRSGDGAIPLWYDINGGLMPGMWRKTVGAVLSAVMNRTGVGAEEVARLCKPALEEWEVRLCIEWAVGVGALVEVAEGSGVEGWRVGEWWWWVAGHV